VAQFLSSRPLMRPISFQVRRFVLFSSRASVGGGPYVIEAAYPIA
jgi:RNA 2',3'-cyclic 3'-phosphodiesterase